MISEVQLLAHRFAAIERTRYSVNQIEIRKDGTVVGTDGKHAIYITKAEDMGDHAGNESAEPIHIPCEVMARVLQFIRSIRLKLPGHKNPKPFKAVKITDNEGCHVFDQNGTRLIIKHDDGVVNFPDVDEATNNIDPKRKEDCRSMYINVHILKKIASALSEMVDEHENQGVEISFAPGKEDAKLGFRMDARGKNGEKITYFLMQMSR